MSHDIPVIHEDERILVVDKPAGVLSAPDRYDPEAPVLTRQLEARFGRLWTVHRLDIDTSGALILARDEEAHRILSEAFELGRVAKTYRAVVRGRPSWKTTVCELPLMPDGDRKHRTVIDGSGKPSVTEFTVLGTYGPLTLIEARPRTGRTHQVRVHLAAIGHPVVCDPLYGDDEPVFLSKIKRRWKGDPYAERPLIFRTALHAWSIELDHPGSGDRVRYEAPYPKDMRALVTQLEKL